MFTPEEFDEMAALLRIRARSFPRWEEEAIKRSEEEIFKDLSVGRPVRQ
jgi:hypothetical protein